MWCALCFPFIASPSGWLLFWHFNIIFMLIHAMFLRLLIIVQMVCLPFSICLPKPINNSYKTLAICLEPPLYYYWFRFHFQWNCPTFAYDMTNQWFAHFLFRPKPQGFKYCGMTMWMWMWIWRTSYRQFPLRYWTLWKSFFSEMKHDTEKTNSKRHCITEISRNHVAVVVDQNSFGRTHLQAHNRIHCTHENKTNCWYFADEMSIVHT